MRQLDRQSRQSIANLTTFHRARQVRFEYELVDETVICIICIPKIHDCSTQIKLHRHEEADYAIFPFFLRLIVKFLIYPLINYIAIIPIAAAELA